MTTAKVAADLNVLVYHWLRYVKGGRVTAIYVFKMAVGRHLGGWSPSWIFAEVKFEGISVSGTFVFVSEPNFL